MSIRFSSHALVRMAEREITEKEVRTALESPHKTGRKDDAALAMKVRANGHLLLIVYRETSEYTFIITVIDTSKVDKYL